MDTRLAILAIGGNSLIKDKTKIAMWYQYEALKETAAHLAGLIQAGMNMVITHGNGPQVGLIYRRGEISVYELPLIPLDICGADTFIISTAVEEVYLNFGQDNQKALRHATLPEIKQYLGEGHFRPGSMKPKIESIIQFLEGAGEKAIITSPENLVKAVRGEAGTTITR